MIEAVTNPGPRLVSAWSQRDEPVQGCGYIVDVPVDDRTASACGRLGRGRIPFNGE